MIVTDEILAEALKLERGMHALRRSLEDLSQEVSEAVSLARYTAVAIERRAFARRTEICAMKLRLDRIERRLDLVD